MNAHSKEIKKDCFIAMAPAWLISTWEVALTSVISVWLSTIMAEFCNAILDGNSDNLKAGIWKAIVGILISVFVFPLMSYICNLFMIRRALIHDRKVMGRFIRKTYLSAVKMELGEAQARLEDDPNSYRLEWVEMMTQTTSLPIVLVYLLYNSIRLDWRLTLITVAVTAVKMAVPVVIRRLNARYDQETRGFATDFRRCETDVTSAPHDTVMFGLRDGMLKRLDGVFQQYYAQTGKKNAALQSTASFFQAILDAICGAIILFVGALFVSRGMATAGTVVAMLGFSSVYDTVIHSAVYIIKGWPIMQTLVERLMILYEDAEPMDGASVENPTALIASGLSCAYDGHPVFEPLNFTIRKGEKIVICGENGSGKSTLLRVLCGLSQEYQGSVTVDGVELRNLNPHMWRHSVSLATQKPYLFSGTVLENLTLGGQVTEAEAYAVLDRMGIVYLAERRISEEEDCLSVGEKQRVSLSRAILKNTPIICLDEPSNHLDADSLQKLMDYIESTEKTIVYISHMESLTALATRRIVVQRVIHPFTNNG